MLVAQKVVQNTQVLSEDILGGDTSRPEAIIAMINPKRRAESESMAVLPLKLYQSKKHSLGAPVPAAWHCKDSPKHFSRTPENSKPRGVKLEGPLLKQNPGIWTRWQQRYFVIQDGELQWWVSSAERENGSHPLNSCSLSKAKIIHKPGSSHVEFTTESTREKSKSYHLDCNVSHSRGNHAHNVDVWIQALESEAIFARRWNELMCIDRSSD
jgi:hypothetical protein